MILVEHSVWSAVHFWGEGDALDANGITAGFAKVEPVNEPGHSTLNGNPAVEDFDRVFDPNKTAASEIELLLGALRTSPGLPVWSIVDCWDEGDTLDWIASTGFSKVEVDNEIGLGNVPVVRF